MAASEMQKAITKLRFLLATVRDKEQEIESTRRQFQRQLDRVPNYAIHGGNSLDATLGMMSEIQERLDEVTNTQKHLAAIKRHAQNELQALDLTYRVEQAKAELAALKMRRCSGEDRGRAQEGKIEELERFVQEASIRAGRIITGEIEDR